MASLLALAGLGFSVAPGRAGYFAIASAAAATVAFGVL
jgi:hypothetical protein